MTLHRFLLRLRSRFQTVVVSAFAMLFVGFSASAHAADLLDTVTQRGTLKIAVEGSYPPFNFKENGQLTGFEAKAHKAISICNANRKGTDLGHLTIRQSDRFRTFFSEGHRR